MVALALPWPRVSRPSARSTALCASSSRLDERGRALVLGGDRADLDLDDAAVLVALDLLELGAGHARGDALDVGEHLPGPLDGHPHPELVGQLHGITSGRLQVARSSTVSMSAARPGHGTSATRSGRRRITTRAPRRPSAAAAARPCDDRRTGLPRSPVVGRRPRSGSWRPGRRGATPRPGTQRLVAEADHHRVVAVPAGPGDARLQRGGHPLGPAGVGTTSPPSGQRGHRQVDGAAHDVGGVEPGGGRGLDRPLDHRPPEVRRQQLVAVAARCGTRDPRPPPARSPRWSRSAGGAGRLTPWIGPSVSRSGRASARPVRRAMISAQIDTAVSSGVRAPMSSPIGARIRARPASSTPASRSRADAVGVGAPAAHGAEVADVGGEGGDDGRHVELVVVGEHADRVAGRERRRRPGSSRRWGQSTTTSSAMREPRPGGEHLPGVAHGHPVAEHLGHPDQRGGEVDGAEDQHPGRRGERLDEHRHRRPRGPRRAAP